MTSRVTRGALAVAATVLTALGATQARDLETVMAVSAPVLGQAGATVSRGGLDATSRDTPPASDGDTSWSHTRRGPRRGSSARSALAGSPGGALDHKGGAGGGLLGRAHRRSAAGSPGATVTADPVSKYSEAGRHRHRR